MLLTAPPLRGFFFDLYSMKERDAYLIEKILEYGVEKQKHNAGEYFETLSSIKQEMLIDHPIKYLTQLFEEVDKIKPCPVEIEFGDITGITFTRFTGRFLEFEGGYLKIYSDKQDEIKRKRKVEDAKIIQGKLFWFTFIISVITFLYNLLDAFFPVVPWVKSILNFG